MSRSLLFASSSGAKHHGAPPSHAEPRLEARTQCPRGLTPPGGSSATSLSMSPGGRPRRPVGLPSHRATRTRSAWQHRSCARRGVRTAAGDAAVTAGGGGRAGLARTCAVPSSRGLRGRWAPGQLRPSAHRSPGATSPPAPRVARRWRLRRKPLDEGQTLRRHLPAGAPRGPRWRWGLPESRPTLASACPLPRAPRCLPGTLSPAFALGPLLGASNPGWPGRTEGPRVSPLFSP